MSEHIFSTAACPAITLTAEEQRRLLAVAERAEVFLSNQVAGNARNATNMDILIARQLVELMDGLRAKIEPAVKR